MRSGRADHSLEFPVVNAGVEDCSGACDREYGRPETRRVHAIDGAGVR